MRVLWLVLAVCAMLVLPQLQISLSPISLHGKTAAVYAWDHDSNGDLHSNDHTGASGNGAGGDDTHGPNL